MTATSVLLAVADQRLPSGGHVHSGGIEQAINDGIVRDTADLTTFLARRVRTTGTVNAAVAAAVVAVLSPAVASPAVASTAVASTEVASTEAASTALPSTVVAELDAELDARTPSPAQRQASRAQGRGLLRTARAAWPDPGPHPSWSSLGARPHHAIVLGCVAAAARLPPLHAATAAAYLCMTGPATAAQRLLALDPVEVAAVTVRLCNLVDAVAADATRLAIACHDRGSWRDLPDAGDPLLDLLAERHAPRGDRLFAS